MAARTVEMAEKWSGTSDPHVGRRCFLGLVACKRPCSKAWMLQMATGIDQVMTTMLKARAVCVQALSPITFFQAEDGIRDSPEGLEFRRVLFR
eukprot:COSAG01_NODE_49002_length_376_cov_0.527076_1_plen_92_part_01